MTLLRAMPAEAYGLYLEEEIAAYAQDKVAVGSWAAEGALERSRAEFATLLPQGLATPDNHLFEILAADDGAVVGAVIGTVVGAIWLAIEREHGTVTGYVYNVGIKPEFQRQGHALRAFQGLELLALELGAASIGLHVFGANAAAQALYRKLGFTVTGINMRKSIAPTITACSSKEP